MTRIPEGLRRQLERAAKRSDRSMNAELIHKIVQAFEWEEARGTVQQWISDSRVATIKELESAMRKFGYTPISMLPQGRMWASPDADLSTLNLAIDAESVVKAMQPALVQALAQALGKLAKKDQQP
jgi:hypothetical protein